MYVPKGVIVEAPLLLTAVGAAAGSILNRRVLIVLEEGAEAEVWEQYLSADAESPSLAPLRLPRVEAMKVPHHGSRDPGLPHVLERLRPRVAAACDDLVSLPLSGRIDSLNVSAAGAVLMYAILQKRLDTST